MSPLGFEGGRISHWHDRGVGPSGYRDHDEVRGQCAVGPWRRLVDLPSRVARHRVTELHDERRGVRQPAKARGNDGGCAGDHRRTTRTRVRVVAKHLACRCDDTELEQVDGRIRPANVARVELDTNEGTQAIHRVAADRPHRPTRSRANDPNSSASLTAASTAAVSRVVEVGGVARLVGRGRACLRARSGRASQFGTARDTH
jgi:hypothetical protein